jgi:hypothetical protein
MRRGVLGDESTSCPACGVDVSTDPSTGAELHAEACPHHDPATCFTCRGLSAGGAH